MAMPWLLAALLCAVARGKITEGTLAKGAGVSWHYLGRFVFDATDLAHASETQLAPIELSTQRLVEPYEQVRACSAARAERAWGAAQRRGCEVLACAGGFAPSRFAPPCARAARCAVRGVRTRSGRLCVSHLLPPSRAPRSLRAQLKLHKGGVAHIELDFGGSVVNWRQRIRSLFRTQDWERTTLAADILQSMHLLVYSGGWENWDKVNSETMTCGEKVAWAKAHGNAFPLSKTDGSSIRQRNARIQELAGATTPSYLFSAAPYGEFGGRNPLVSGLWRWSADGARAETILTFQAALPHSFFFAFAWCADVEEIEPTQPLATKAEALYRVPASSDAGGDLSGIRFRLEMRNMPTDGGGAGLSHFGADEAANLYLAAIGVAWGVAQLVLMQATQIALACKMKLHRIVVFLAGAIFCQALGMILLLAKQIHYADRGVQSFWLGFFAQLLPLCAEAIVLFDLVLVAKGYAITRRKLSAATWKKIFAFMAAYVSLQLMLFVWAKFGYTEADAVYYMQAPPGFMLVLMRGFAVPWILWSVSTSLKKKRKKRFFVGFAVGAVAWVASYPLLWLFSWLLPDSMRAQVMLCFEIIIACSAQTALTLLVFPLWPELNLQCCGKRCSFGCFPFHKTTWQVDDPVNFDPPPPAAPGAVRARRPIVVDASASASGGGGGAVTLGVQQVGRAYLLQVVEPGDAGAGGGARRRRDPRRRGGRDGRDGSASPRSGDESGAEFGHHEGDDSELSEGGRDTAAGDSRRRARTNAVGTGRGAARPNLIDRVGTARQRGRANQVPSRIAAELRAKKERRRATANARPGAGTQLLLTAAGGTSARAIPPPTDPWSGEPPYVKTAEEKRIDHYATKQLRVARRFATLLQLKTMDMVDRARGIVASVEELRIPDAGGDEWMDYVESREVRAESAAGERDGERDAEHADLARWRRERRSPARLAPADGGEDGVELRSLTTEAEHPHHPDRVERGADAGAEPGAADARRPSQPSFAMPNVGASEGGRERWRSSFSSRGSNDEERASLTPRAIRHRNADALTRDVDDSDMAAGDEDDETQAAQTDARESDNEEEWERGGVASAPRSKWRTARLQMSAAAAVAAPVTERRIERILREQKVRVFCCVGAAQRTLGLSLSFPLFSLFPPPLSLSLLHSRSLFGVSHPPPPPS